MILDDSTSAVDMNTDAKIRDSLSKEFKDTTVFIIAQRIASIQDADVIIFMEDGKVVAHGNHEEMKKICEQYREICAEQEKGVISE